MPEYRNPPTEDQRPIRQTRLGHIRFGLIQFVVAIGFLVGAVLIYREFVASRPPIPMRPASEIAVPVRVLPAEPGDHSPLLRLYGEIRAGQRLEVLAPVGGVVEAVSPNLRDGGHVSAGEMLFEIERFRYEIARAEARLHISEARARLNELELTLEGDLTRLELLQEALAIAERDFERAARLVESQTVSESASDKRALALNTQRQEEARQRNRINVGAALVEQQRAAITRLEKTVELAARDLADTRVTAPFSGFLDQVTAETGRSVGRNEQVAVLLDSDWLEAHFVLSRIQAGRILSDSDTLVGRAVTVRWSLGDTQREFGAVIERTGATIDARTGGIDVVARITDSTAGDLLRAGAFVEILVPDRQYRDVLRVPEAAVYHQDRVFVLDSDNRLSAVPVAVVGRDGNHLFVTGDIPAGASILAMRLPGIGDGVKVLPDPANETTGNGG